MLIPSSNVSLLSVSRFNKAGCRIEFLNGRCTISDAKTNELICHRYDFLVRIFRMDLLLKNFFYSLLRIDHNPLCSLCSHDLCLLPLSYVSLFTQVYGQEKSLSYYDLFDFGVLLIYGRTPTLILFHFLYHPTTPIFPVYVVQRQPHLEKDTTRSRSVVIRKIPTVPRRTFVTPD